MESVLLIFALVLLLLSFVLYFINFSLYKARVNKMLGKVKQFDGELPIVGHAFIPTFRKLENSEDIYTVLSELSKDRTEDQRLWMFNMPFLLLNNINTIEKILTNQNTVQKSHIYSLLGMNIFDGVFVAPASKWKKMRKRLNLTFNPKFYTHYINMMNYHAKIFVAVWKRFHRMNGDSYQNMHILVAKCLFDIITSTHFGINTKQQFNDGTNFVAELISYTDQAFQRIFRPWLHPNPIYKRTKIYSKIYGVLDSYTPFIEKMVRMSEDYQKQLDMKGNELGWKSYSSLSKEELEERGEKASLLRIGHHMSDLIFAGGDTTAVTTSSVLYYLAKYPEYQEKAYNEIVQALQDEPDIDLNQIEIDKFVDRLLSANINQREDKKGTEFINHSTQRSDWDFAGDLPKNWCTWTRNRMDSLEFLDTLIKETLRLYSPPAIIRYLKTDVDVGDYVVPKGTHVAIFINNVHRNPKYWEKPDEFYPEHFSAENVKSRPKYAFIPFSQGPRDCPGKVFAKYTVKCIVAETIRNFKIEVDPSHDSTKKKLVFMIELVGGYPIKLIPRNST